MAVTNFIPQLWSARLLAHLDKAHVYANLVNRDYEGDISAYGDTVKIQQIGDITVGDYVKNTDITDPEALAGTTQSLVIDQGKFFNFQIDDVDNAQTNPKLMDEAMMRAAYALADTTDKFVASKYTDVPVSNQIGNDTTPIVLTADNVYDEFVALAQALDEANVPRIGRWTVTAPWVYAMLLKNDLFVHATQKGDSVVATGEVGSVAGFTVYVSNNVPNTAGAKYKILAGTAAGISYAEQVVKTEAYRMEKRFADAVKGLHVYGGKTVQPNCLACLTASKTA